MTRDEVIARLPSGEHACAFCGDPVATRAEGIAHVTEKHPVIDRETCGPFVIETVCYPLWGERQRKLYTFRRLMFREKEVKEAQANVGMFAAGAVWAIEHGVATQ